MKKKIYCVQVFNLQLSKEPKDKYFYYATFIHHYSKKKIKVDELKINKFLRNSYKKFIKYYEYISMFTDSIPLFMKRNDKFHYIVEIVQKDGTIKRSCLSYN